jgi:maltose alpha-D-glucosyltransferase/alpha-amylase
MIRMRKEVPEIGWGEFKVLPTGNDGVFALRFDWCNNTVVTIHNMLGEAAEIQLRVGDERGRQLSNLLTQDHSQANGRGTHRIVMEPYGYHWYRTGGLGYLLERTSM